MLHLDLSSIELNDLELRLIFYLKDINQASTYFFYGREIIVKFSNVILRKQERLTFRTASDQTKNKNKKGNSLSTDNA